jgi:hypothetical protein
MAGDIALRRKFVLRYYARDFLASHKEKRATEKTATLWFYWLGN